MDLQQKLSFQAIIPTFQRGETPCFLHRVFTPPATPENPAFRHFRRMYRFQVSCDTQWGEAQGGWDFAGVLPLFVNKNPNSW